MARWFLKNGRLRFDNLAALHRLFGLNYLLPVTGRLVDFLFGDEAGRHQSRVGKVAGSGAGVSYGK
jgi:hypothetical protein